MKNVVIGFLGTQKDMGKRRRWKPTRSLVQHDHFHVDRLELLYDMNFHRLARHDGGKALRQRPDAHDVDAGGPHHSPTRQLKHERLQLLEFGWRFGVQGQSRFRIGPVDYTIPAARAGKRTARRDLRPGFH